MELFEIIVVDDGSQDDTGQQVERWAGHHPGCRVLLVRQHTLGQPLPVIKGQPLPKRLCCCSPTRTASRPGWIEALLDGFAGPEPPAGLMGTYRSEQRSLAARFAQLEFEDRYRRMLHQRGVGSGGYLFRRLSARSFSCRRAALILAS